MKFKKGMKFSNGLQRDIEIIDILPNGMIEFNYIENPEPFPFWGSQESFNNWIEKTGAKLL